MLARLQKRTQTGTESDDDTALKQSNTTEAENAGAPPWG